MTREEAAELNRQVIADVLMLPIVDCKSETRPDGPFALKIHNDYYLGLEGRPFAPSTDGNSGIRLMKLLSREWNWRVSDLPSWTIYPRLDGRWAVYMGNDVLEEGDTFQEALCRTAISYRRDYPVEMDAE